MEEEKNYQAVSHSESHSQLGMWGVVLIIVACLAIGGVAFIAHERGELKKISAQNAAMTTALDQTRSQLQDVTAKLSQLAEAQQAAQAARVSNPAPIQQRGKRVAVRRDDPRWKQVQDKLAEQQKAIDSTQSDLANGKTELSGSIARNHEQLVALARKGERNYYEFDLNRSKQFTREGPISVSLRKANAKQDYADLGLIVDDAHLAKKHVNMFEPVMVYTSESKQPVELVINQVSKDHIHGYVSAAKYKPSDLQALNGLTDNPAGDSASASETANSSSNTPQLRSRAQR